MKTKIRNIVTVALAAAFVISSLSTAQAGPNQPPPPKKAMAVKKAPPPCRGCAETGRAGCVRCAAPAAAQTEKVGSWGEWAGPAYANEPLYGSDIKIFDVAQAGFRSLYRPGRSGELCLVERELTGTKTKEISLGKVLFVETPRSVAIGLIGNLASPSKVIQNNDGGNGYGGGGGVGYGGAGGGGGNAANATSVLVKVGNPVD